MYNRFFVTGLLVMVLASVGLRAEELARVGGDAITREEFEAKAQYEEINLKRKMTKPERLNLLKSLVNQRLLVAEAKRQKMDRDPAFKAFVLEMERKALADRVYEAEVGSKTRVSSEEAKRFYTENPTVFDVAEVGQIFIGLVPGSEAASEKKAADLKAALRAAPKTFAAVAKAQSDDTESKVRGGDLGTLHRGILVEALDRAVFSAKAPTLLGPIRSEYGFHILQVRSLQHLSWEQVEKTLPEELQRARAGKLQKDLIEKLAKKDKFSLNEDKL